jgi:hypothetical protein
VLSALGGGKSGSEAAPRDTGAVPPPQTDGSVRETFGVTPHDPILCDQPAGERLYIATLRCPSGHGFGGPRRGSMSGRCTDPQHHVAMISLPGLDPAQECIVDCYDLRCEGGEYSCTLYFDMYHPDAPPQPAPRGLTRA